MVTVDLMVRLGRLGYPLGLRVCSFGAQTRPVLVHAGEMATT